MKLFNLIRILITLALVYGAYTETGVFTGISLLLIFTGFEINAFLHLKAKND